MAARDVFISPLNSIAMRPETGTGHLDDSWQSELIRQGQVRDYYLQPVARADRFRFAFDATANTSHTVKIVDCRGVTAYTVPQTDTTVIPGNIAPDGSQRTSYLHKMPDWSGIATYGVYFVVLTVVFDGTHTGRYISEPILLQNAHDGTLLIEYTSTQNTQGLYFEQLPMRPAFRIQAYIDGMQAVSSDTVYEDQGYDLQQLDSTPYRSWTLYVGEPSGIADWTLDKLNRIFSCDTVYLKGRQYLKADGAKWEIARELSSPLITASIAIREADNAEGFDYTDASPLLFTVPAYPFFIQSIAIGRTAPDTQLITGPARIGNSTQLGAWITATNAQLSNRELFGSVALNGSEVSYTNGAGENYAVGKSYIATTYFTFNFNSPGSAGPSFPSLSFQIYNASIGVSWGDGTVSPSSAFSSTATVTHSYPAIAGVFPVEIWGSTERFSISDGRRQGLSGTLPASLRTLTVSGGTFPANTFNFSLLSGLTNLSSLSVVNAGLTAANGFNAYNLPKLSSINFSGNALSSSVVSAFMYDVWYNSIRNTPNITAGAFSIAGQTPTATLNANGNYYKSLLQASPLSWTVNN